VKPALHAFAVAAALAGLVVVLSGPASADTASASYRQAVSDALDIVRTATPGDVSSAQQAITILKTGTGDTQPEIQLDLSARPPKFDDAEKRLAALLEAIDHPASTANPALAQSKLHDVLSMSRYDALHQAPGPFDQFAQWVRDRIRDLLRALFGASGPGGTVPAWFIYSIGVLIMAAVALVVFRATRGRFSSGAVSEEVEGPRTPSDFFAQADRLAARGDRVGAIRALCAGVAATLAGERTWEGSPLTVRELFQRAPDPASLRPLLLPFEAAVYGGRDVDEPTYRRAAAVAASFRQPVEKVKAA
jgi:hypothetical protein